MIIGIDGNEANIKNRVGVGQYAYNIIQSLYKLDSKNQYIVYLKNEPLSDLPKPRQNWSYKVFGPQKLWTKIALPFKLFTQKEKLDLFYSPSHYSPEFSPFPTVPTIHDLGYLESQNQFTKKDLYQLINWTKKSIDKARHIIAVSEFTKNELKRIYQIPLDKITVAFNGVGNIPEVSKKDIDNTLKKFKIDNDFILYLGTLKPNKNIPFLIKSFAKLLKDMPKSPLKLVVAGKKGWLFDDIFKTVVEEKLKEKVIFTDYISETEKWSLLKSAKMVVLPSTYEGFGIPAIEAMKIGTPVIVSCIPPFIEVTGSLAPSVDPNNTAELKTVMKGILESTIKVDKDRSRLQTDKYTWDNSAKNLIKTFETLVLR